MSERCVERNGTVCYICVGYRRAFTFYTFQSRCINQEVVFHRGLV